MFSSFIFSIKITTSVYPVPSVCQFDQLGDWFESLADILHWNLRKVQSSFDNSQGNESDEQSQNDENTTSEEQGQNSNDENTTDEKQVQNSNNEKQQVQNSNGENVTNGNQNSLTDSTTDDSTHVFL